MILAVAFCVAFGAWAETETVGDYTWTYRINDDTAEIFNDYSAAISPKPHGAVTIPSVLGGKSVTIIGDYAFYGCSGLTSVTIPDSVAGVGRYAFTDCTNLTGVYITDLTAWCRIHFDQWGANPLEYAHNLYINGTLLEDLIIPDGVTSIECDAFNGGSCFTSVTIPSGVTNIDAYAFYECTGLRAVHTPSLIDWCKISFYGKYDNPLIYAHDLYVDVPIVEDMFPIAVDRGALWYMHNLYVDLYVDGSIVEDFVPVVVELNAAGGYVSVGHFIAYPGCQIDELPTPIQTGYDFLGWFTLAEGGERVSCGISCETNMTLFAHWEKEEYTIVFNSFMDGVEIAPRTRRYGEAIGELPVIEADRYGYTFGGWENVDEGTIVTSNMMISAIWNRNVFAVSFDTHAEGKAISDVAKFYAESFGILPGLTWSGHVFLGWYTDEFGGEEITATDKVMSDITLHAHWAEGPFACEYGGALWNYQSYNGVATIISATTSEDSLTIPEMLGGAEVVEIPAACFAQTASLKCLSIPNSVTNIAEYAFYSCTNLEEVVFSDGLMKIGSGAFAKSTKLKDVILPSTLIALGDKYAPSKACWGDEDACARLTSYAKDFLSFTAWGTICGESEGCELSCDWKTTSSHGYHFSRVGETNTMSRSDICNSSRNARVEGVHCAMGVFEGCEALESVSLNYGLRQIGAGTFKNCTSLKSLRVPDTVISIGGHAESVEECFDRSVSTVSDLLETNDYKPSLLTSDRAIDNVSRHSTYKGSGFLQGCSGLTNAMLSANLGYLGPYSFAGCTNLVSIRLPDSLRTLNEGTFSGCAKLETVALPKALDLIGGYEFTSQSEYFSCRDTLAQNGSHPSTLMLEEEITTQYDADGGVLAVDTLISNGGTPSAITIYSKTNIVDNADGTFTVEGLLVQNEMVTNLVTYVVEYDDIDLDNRWQDGVGTIFVPKTIIGIDIDVAGRDCLGELMDFVSARYSGAAGKSLAARNRFSPAAPTYNGKTFSPDSGVFSGCVSLKSITLPDTVRRIADYAFYDCAELASVNVPDSLEVVGYDAFGGMTSLPDFNAPWQGNTSTIDDMLSNGRTFDEIASLFAGVSTFATDANESLSQEDRVHIACSFANSVIYALNRFGSADRFSTFHGIGDVLNSLSDVLRVTGTSLTASVQQEIATGVFRAATNALVSLTAVEHDLSTIKSFDGVGDTLTGLANVFDATGAGLAVYQQQLFAEGAFAATTNVLVSIKSAERDFSNLESFAGVGDILTGLADVLCALGANSSEEEQTRFVCIVTECATSMISALMDGTVLVPSLESYNGIGDVFMGLHDLYSSLYPKLSAGRKVMLSDMIYDSMTLAKDVIMVSDKPIDDELSKLLSGAGECLKFIDGAADDPIPILLLGTTNNEIIDLVKDIAFVDATLYDVISADVNEYSAFREWALKVKGVGANASAPAGANAVVNAPHAAAAFLLGATKLFENEPIIKMCDVSIESSPGCGGVQGTMIVGVAVKDGERTVAVDAAKVAAMFEATSDLGDWNGAALPVTIEPLGCENAAMQFRVAPSSYAAPQVFLRIRQ